MNTNLLKLKNIGVPVVILLLVIIGVIFLLTRNNQTTNTATDLPLSYTSLSNADITVLPVENLKQAKLSGKTVSFSDSYIINTVIQGKTLDALTCGKDQNDSCIVNYITDNTDTYYLSTPFEPIAHDSLDRSKDIARPFEATTGSIFLKYEVLNAVDEAGQPLTDQNRTVQIYGCITDTICVGSGFLNTSDLATNKAQVAKFEDFVKSLTVN